MKKSIPLIRSAVLMPMIRWMRANGRPVRERLDAVGLGYASDAAPERPVPLLGVLELFRSMGALEGPDIGVRAVATSGLADLGTFGRLILEAGTPRDALQRAVAALPRYSTHELLSLHRRPGGVCVRAGWSLILDEVAMHLTQQFTATLVLGLCAATGRAPASRAAFTSCRIRTSGLNISASGLDQGLRAQRRKRRSISTLTTKCSMRLCLLAIGAGSRPRPTGRR